MRGPFGKGYADKPSHFHQRETMIPSVWGGGRRAAPYVRCSFLQFLKFHREITGRFLLGGMEGLLNPNNAGIFKIVFIWQRRELCE